MSNESKLILCPYCGQTQSHADRCSACSGMFEPLSRLATQIEMGPWFLRDTANPFQPGRSYEALKRMAKSGKIKPATVLRGPTTHQFWSLARNTAGVAHLVGYCHRCAAKVQADHVACPECAAMFMEVPERNELGLHYTCENSVSQAQEALKQQITNRQLAKPDTDAKAPAAKPSSDSSDATKPDPDSEDKSPPSNGQGGERTAESGGDTRAVDAAPKADGKPAAEVACTITKTITGKTYTVEPVTLEEVAEPAEETIALIDEQAAQQKTVESEALAQELADAPANPQRYVPYPNRWTAASVWLLVATLLMCASLIGLFVTQSGLGRPNTAYSATPASSAYATQPQWNQGPHQSLSALLRDISDREDRLAQQDVPNMQVATLQEYEPMTTAEVLENRIIRVDNLVRIGRLHEALIALESIARSMPPEESPEKVERVIKALEKEIHDEESPSFFGVPIE